MFKLIAYTAALSLAALAPASAETAAPDLTQVRTKATPLVQEKTSDRTPGASITGAAGTEVARTPFGTSDRTPENHYVLPSH